MAAILAPPQYVFVEGLNWLEKLHPEKYGFRLEDHEALLWQDATRNGFLKWLIETNDGCEFILLKDVFWLAPLSSENESCGAITHFKIFNSIV